MDAKTLEALAKKALDERDDVRKRLDAHWELGTAATVAAMREVHMPYVHGMSREYAYARRSLYNAYYDMTSVPWTEHEHREAVRRETKQAATGTNDAPVANAETKRKLVACAQALLAVCAGWALAAIAQNAAR